MSIKRSMGIAALAAVSLAVGSASSGNAAKVDTNGATASFVIPGQTPALSICIDNEETSEDDKTCAPTGSAIRNLTVSGEAKSSSQSLTLDALQGAGTTQNGAACKTVVNYKLVFGFQRSSNGGTLAITWEEVAADGTVAPKRVDFDNDATGDQDLVIPKSEAGQSRAVSLCAM